MLGICLSQRKLYQQATEEVEVGVRLAPADSFSHYALAKVLLEREDLPGALIAIETAIRLDTGDANYYWLLGTILQLQRQWREALWAAEKGLELDPANTDCENLRAQALMWGGYCSQAEASSDRALAREPLDATGQATRGWLLLREGNAEVAQAHFREALRITPDDDWARRGLIESIKAGNPIYGRLLRLYFLLTRMSYATVLALSLSFGVAYNLLSEDSATEWIGTALLFALVLMFFPVPLSNLLVWFHPLGRLALSGEQIAFATATAILSALALACLATWALTGSALSWFAAMCCLINTLGWWLPFLCPAGWPRRIMIINSSILRYSAWLVWSWLLFFGCMRRLPARSPNYS